MFLFYRFRNLFEFVVDFIIVEISLLLFYRFYYSDVDLSFLVLDLVYHRENKISCQLF